MTSVASVVPLARDWVGQVLASASDAIVVVDRDQRMVFVNRQVGELFGYSIEELLGRPLEVLLPADQAGGHRVHVERFMRSGRSKRVMGMARKLYGRRRNGVAFAIEATISRASIDGRDYATAILRDASCTTRADDLVRAISDLVACQEGDLLRRIPAFLQRATDAETCFVAIGGKEGWTVHSSARDAPQVVLMSGGLLSTAKSVPSVKCHGDLDARFPRARWLAGNGQHLLCYRALHDEPDVFLVGMRNREPFSPEAETLARLHGLVLRAWAKAPARPARSTTMPPPDVAAPTSLDPSVGFLDQLPTPTFIADDLGRCEYANQGWGDLSGWDEEKSGRWLDAVHQLDLQKVEALWRRAVATGTRFRHELRIVREADAQTTWVLVEGSPQRHVRGGRWTVTFMDITAQRAIAADLRTTQQQLAEALRIARLGHWRWSPATDQLTWSPEVTAMLGVASEPGTSRDEFFDRFLADEASARLMQNRLRIALRGREVEPFELTLRRDEDRKLVVRVRLEVVRSWSGSPLEVIGTLQDVTREYETDQRLRETQRLEAMGRLSGGIAHDFNNMLTVISSAALLLSMERHPPDQQELLDDIMQAADRSTALTRQLLAFGRRQVLEPRAIALDTVFDNLSRVLPRLCEGRVGLDLDIPSGLTCFVDEAQLEQVIVNLAVNARDAIGEEGRIQFVADEVVVQKGDGLHARGVRPRSYIRLRVADDGAGIPEAVRPHIFEPFFTTKGPERGSGLGLATVRGILEQSNGSILVDTKRGEGTTFSVFLPSAAAVQGEEAPSSRPRSTPAPEGAAVVVVDDEPMVRRTFAKVLKGAGYRVEAFSDGAEAQAFFANGGEADLVLTDVHMPKVDGPGLADWLEQQRPDLPIVFITGYAHHPTITKGAAAGTIQVLPKPISSERLTEAIARSLVRSSHRWATA